ncbi:MAG: DUF3429 domain-containing protein [Pseudomonadota bacterium]
MLRFADVPPAARALGFAGLLPFFWGVLTMWVQPLETLTLNAVGPRFIGPYVLLNYGTIILAFMSGVLWGFAASAQGWARVAGLALSVVPALWAFFFVTGGPGPAAIALIAGFLGVLLIDIFLWQARLTPPWWLALRIPLTAVVCLCLAVPALAP